MKKGKKNPTKQGKDQQPQGSKEGWATVFTYEEGGTPYLIREVLEISENYFLDPFCP